MPAIVPIKELKNTAKISQLCRESSEPVYITKNGYGDMVLMSMEAYEKLIHQQKIYQELELAEQQFQQGESVDAEDSLHALRKKYGL